MKLVRFNLARERERGVVRDLVREYRAEADWKTVGGLLEKLGAAADATDKARAAAISVEHSPINERDARRYRRLRFLGCSVRGQLDPKIVASGPSLDDLVDADMRLVPDRGEGESQ